MQLKTQLANYSQRIRNMKQNNNNKNNTNNNNDNNISNNGLRARSLPLLDATSSSSSSNNGLNNSIETRLKSSRINQDVLDKWQNDLGHQCNQYIESCIMIMNNVKRMIDIKRHIGKNEQELTIMKEQISKIDIGLSKLSKRKQIRLTLKENENATMENMSDEDSQLLNFPPSPIPLMDDINRINTSGSSTSSGNSNAATILGADGHGSNTVNRHENRKKRETINRRNRGKMSGISGIFGASTVSASPGWGVSPVPAPHGGHGSHGSVGGKKFEGRFSESTGGSESANDINITNGNNNNNKYGNGASMINFDEMSFESTVNEAKDIQNEMQQLEEKMMQLKKRAAVNETIIGNGDERKIDAESQPLDELSRFCCCCFCFTFYSFL